MGMTSHHTWKFPVPQARLTLISAHAICVCLLVHHVRSGHVGIGIVEAGRRWAPNAVCCVCHVTMREMPHQRCSSLNSNQSLVWSSTTLPLLRCFVQTAWNVTAGL